MIQLGQRAPVALALALALGTGCADGGDGDSETTFSNGDGDAGDGDGDSAGDGDGDSARDGDGDSGGDGDGDSAGDGDGDTSSSGDGDGDGDTAGDGNGDGDPPPGSCPDGGSITIDAQFRDTENNTMLAPQVFENCEYSYGSATDGLLLTYMLEDASVFQVTLLNPTEGVHPVTADDPNAYVTMNMTDGVPPGWQGQYALGEGVVDLVDYIGLPTYVIEFQVDATLVYDKYEVDISAHGTVELQ